MGRTGRPPVPVGGALILGSWRSGRKAKAVVPLFQSTGPASLQAGPVDRDQVNGTPLNTAQAQSLPPRSAPVSVRWATGRGRRPDGRGSLPLTAASSMMQQSAQEFDSVSSRPAISRPLLGSPLQPGSWPHRCVAGRRCGPAMGQGDGRRSLSSDQTCRGAGRRSEGDRIPATGRPEPRCPRRLRSGTAMG